MVLPLAGIAAGAGGGSVLGGLSSFAPLASLLGGGGTEVNVSNSANNTTSVTLTSLLQNQSPGNTEAGSAGQSGGSAGSTASSQPDQPAGGSIGNPLDFTPLSARNVEEQSNGGPVDVSMTVLLAFGAMLAIGGYMAFGGDKGGK